MRLLDKVAIITGAGRGIGQATAVKFASEGAEVVVCDLDAEWIEETVAMRQKARGQAMGYVADVRDIKSLEGILSKIPERVLRALEKKSRSGASASPRKSPMPLRGWLRTKQAMSTAR